MAFDIVAENRFIFILYKLPKRSCVRIPVEYYHCVVSSVDFFNVHTYL